MCDPNNAHFACVAINIMESWSSSECLASDTESSEPRIPKKKKYCQTYCKQWESQIKWLASSSKGDQYGFCTTYKGQKWRPKDLLLNHWYLLGVGSNQVPTVMEPGGRKGGGNNFNDSVVMKFIYINFIIIIPLTCLHFLDFFVSEPGNTVNV